MTAMKILFAVVGLVCLYASTQASVYYRPNGGWGPWGKYCKCSKSCGGGDQFRKRVCIYPPCQGSDKQTRACNKKGCKVDGGWGVWSKYSDCSKTCKSGTQSRNRKCNNPAPANGGKGCVGASSQSRVCNNNVPCPVDGGWGDWSKYSDCSKTCKSGTQSRNRKCNNPAPANGGKNCVGPSSQSRVCNDNVPCPVDGGWGDWSEYSDCSKTCKSGTQSRNRKCNNPAPANGGKECVGPSSQSRVCNDNVPCPVNGGWGDWSEYSVCSKTCKSGTQSRNRKCNNPAPANGGKKCVGPSSQSRVCNDNVPCPVDGGWGDWSEYSDCSKTCKSGTQSRNRKCNNPAPANGGKQCVGASSQSRVCNNNVPCPVSVRFNPVNYNTVERNDVTVTIVRSGDLQQATKVFLSTSDGTAKKQSDYQPLNKRPVNFKPGEDKQNVKIDIVDDKNIENKETFYAELSSDSPSVKIIPAGRKATIGINDDDSQFRFQKLQYFVKETAKKVTLVILRSGSTSSKQIARVQTKDGSAVSSAGGDFVSVGNPNPSSVEFGPGDKQETVSVTINDDNADEKKEKFTVLLSTNDGSATVKDKYDVATVYIIDNDVDGGWGKWSSWGKCSKSCGKGIQYSNRKCDNPRKQGGGKDCKGPARRSRSCYLKKYCPINGGYSSWSKWGKCNKSCGKGYCKRKRYCTNPRPQYGGKSCSRYGSSQQTKVCSARPCPVNGGYSPWSKWSSCSRSCGPGICKRRRYCNKPKPQYGGKQCVGIPVQTKKCNLRPCPYARPPVYQPPPAYKPPPQPYYDQYEN